jgi:hypothetical protein
MPNKTLNMIVLMILCHCLPSQAADFCVSNASELSSALSTAANNGQADTIKLMPGIYSGSFVYIAAASEVFDLSLSGGWTAFIDTPCFFEGSDAFETILDGDSMNLVLRILPAGGADIEVKNLTIINGQSTFGLVGGLEITDSSTFGHALIEKVAFINNSGEHFGALQIHNAYRTTVRNSLFTLNSNDPGNSMIRTATATITQLQGIPNEGIYFNNNTVINNTTLGGSGFHAAGIDLAVNGMGSGIYLANNLFHNNDGNDIKVPVTEDNPHLMYNNNYQSFGGLFTNDVSTSGNYTQTPVFDQPGLFNFTPSLLSADINAGRNPPPFVPVPTPFGFFWQLGTTDINGAPRVQDGRVDVGAYEAAAEIPIFINGFD